MDTESIDLDYPFASASSQDKIVILGGSLKHNEVFVLSAGEE